MWAKSVKRTGSNRHSLVYLFPGFFRPGTHHDGPTTGVGLACWGATAHEQRCHELKLTVGYAITSLEPE